MAVRERLENSNPSRYYIDVHVILGTIIVRSEVFVQSSFSNIEKCIFISIEYIDTHEIYVYIYFIHTFSYTHNTSI